ncbi:MAG: hypothetical protein RMJ67_01130 [Elusimicrobiota bacterium]|nr:hypothetical protein [Endomicrobiia bacterium]MDW8165106.1 hypothetical protein [Elusimicrobiota bacterium]
MITIPPEYEEKYGFKTSDIRTIANDMLVIKRKYGQIIDQISSTLNIDKELIYAFQAIEAPYRVFGNKQETVVSPAGAVGLMQVAPDGANDIVVIYNLNNKLPQRVRELIEKKGKSCLLKAKYVGHYKQFNCQGLTKEDLFDGELNLWIGGMMLKRQLEFYPNRLDLVVYSYNFSPTFSKDHANKRLQSYPTIQDTLRNQKVPTETKRYIVWLLGKNGTLNVAIALKRDNQI